MKVGYRRSVAGDGFFEIQRVALEAAGCRLLFEDHGVSGVNPCKPGLEQLLEALQPDDVLVVWRLDRLARDISDVLEVLVQVLVLGAGLVSLKDGIDSDLLGSEGLLVVVRALLSHRGHVEAERALAERQRRLDALRGPGRPGSMSDAKWAEARECFEAGETSVARVAGKIGVCRQALYRKRRAEGT